MKGFKVSLLALLALAALFIVSFSPSVQSSKELPHNPPPAAVSLLYREADSILLATCVSVAGPGERAPASRFCVDRVLDGSAKEGDTFILPSEASPGIRYLLYLRSGENGPRLLTDEAIPVESGSIVFENEVISIESIAEDIERQRQIVTVPSHAYYYGSLSSLAFACDEIVIGRVLGASEPTETVCRSVTKGESTLSTLPITFVRIKVENDFYGSLSYGDKLEIAIAPYNSISVMNATDLSPMTADAPPVLTPEVGRSYIFFLVKGEDRKTVRYFPVNPYEGCVLLSGGSVVHPYYNDALSGLDDLTGFSRKLRSIFFPTDDISAAP